MPTTSPEFNAMMRAIGRIEGKLDRALLDVSNIEKRQDDTERQLNWARGGLAVLGTIFSLVSFPRLLDFLAALPR